MAFYLYNLTGQSPLETITADFIYFRLHRQAGPYQGQYDENVLRSWAKTCMAWSHPRKDVYGYFDLDEKDYAIKDARICKDMVQKQTT